MLEEKILNEAKILFSKFGFKRVSMDEIAYNSGVTKKTVYSHFENKEALFMAILSRELNNMKEIITRNENKDIPYFEKFQISLYELAKYKKENELILQAVHDYEHFGDLHSKETLETFDLMVIDFIKEKINTAIKNKYIKECNVELVAFVVYKIYTSLMYEWKSEKEPLDEKKISEFVTSILKDGLFIK